MMLFSQTAMKDREKHKIALTAYKKHVKEIEDWYDEMKVRQATTPQATDSVPELQKQLLENKVCTMSSLNFTTLFANSADDKLVIFFFLFFPENRI